MSPYSLLPTSLAGWALPRYAGGSGCDKTQAEALKALQRTLYSPTWQAFSVDNVWNGVIPTGLGCFYYHLEGNKVMAMVNANEALHATWYPNGPGVSSQE